MALKTKRTGYQQHSLIWRTGMGLVLLLATATGKAQYDSQMLNDIATQYEKVYVKLDRDVYVTGGIMRYRAFLADAGLVQENVRSRILYFELTGTELTEPIRWRINLNHGNASGTYEIPASLPSGVYALRAFTNWIRNGDPDYIFSNDILLLNISDESTEEIALGLPPPDQAGLISFFPEGGTVIENIACKIGYRLNSGEDAPLPGLLTIKENDSTVVLRVKPDSSGFGTFVFLPETGKDYYAELTLAEDQTVRVALPYVEPFGYSLQAEEVQGGVNVAIRGRNQNEDLRTSLHLVAESRGRILMDTVFAMTGESRLIRIPPGRLTTGIVYLTLYDSRRFSLGNRLFYLDGSGGNGNIRVSGLREAYAGLENIRFELALDGFAPQDTASFAISVSEQHPFRDLIGQQGIGAYMLLSSEIKELPVSLRDMSDLSAGRIQDLLLLVSANDYAWNYSNKTILSDCIYEKEQNGYILKGRLAHKSTGEPLADASIIVGTADSIAPRLIYCGTDENGEFLTLLNPFFDNKDIVLQVADDVEPSDLSWTLEQRNIAMPVLRKAAHPLTATEKEYAQRSRDIALIGEVYGNAPPVSAQPSQGPEIIFLHPDLVVYPSDFTELVNFKEIADNIVPTVRFIRRNRQYSIEVFNNNSELWLSNSRVLLNGVLFRDLDYIATLGSDDIVKIEVYNTNVLFGKLTLPGLIAIYTTDGEVPDPYLKSNAYVLANDVPANDLPGLVFAVEANTGQDPALPDFRQVLYWSPDLKIAGSETVILEFDASLLKGSYVLDIQGISESGVPLGKRLSFTVE